MKKVIILLAFLSISTWSLRAQDSELQLVEQTLNYYLDGGTNNDFNQLSKAFHPTATMKYIGDEYKEVNALEFFKKGMKPGPKQNRKTSIVAVSIMGNAASAQLEIEYPSFSFIDYMHLLKVDGEWKIVSKIFYRKVADQD